MSQSNRSHRGWAGTALLGLVSVLGGCALQNGTVALSTADDEAVATRNSEGLSSYTPEYSWDQSKPSKRMLSSAKNVCFLTGVHGAFRSTLDRVKVSNVRGFWYLTGSSHQVGVGGTARCFPYDASKVIATRVNDSSATSDLDLGAHRLCALSRVSGNFEASGASVGIYQASNGHWFLQTLAGSGELNGGAICLDEAATAPLNVSRIFDASQGDASLIVADLAPHRDQVTEPLKGPACFLMRMAGRFSSKDDAVETYVASAKGAWNYYLHAAGSQPEVAASGVCLY